MTVHKQLQGLVPTAEVFGWTEDGGQTFIDMSLIEGETLEKRWNYLNETERQDVCLQLKRMARMWRNLQPDTDDRYIGE